MSALVYCNTTGRMKDVFSGRNVAIEIYPEQSDDVLRRRVRRELPNGEYAYHICKGCGNYKVSIDGDIETAEIVDQCRECVNV